MGAEIQQHHQLTQQLLQIQLYQPTQPAINSTQPTVNTTTVEPVPPQNTTTSKAPSTTNPSQSSGGSLSGAVIAIIVLVSLTVLVIIGFVVYKKCFKRQQTSPFYNLN